MLNKIVLVITLTLVGSVLYSQNTSNTFLGSKGLYKMQQTKYTPVPKGYEAVFINHVGRHGARHLTTDVNVSFAYKLLYKADSLHELSAKGKLLKQKLEKLNIIEQGNIESISEEGKKEQWEIAGRMYEHFMPVFQSDKPVINIGVTRKFRTAQTGEAFLQKLKAEGKDPQITSAIDDTTLLFYFLSPAYSEFYRKGAPTKLIDALRTASKYEELTKRFTQSFFQPDFFKNLQQRDYNRFTSDVFGFTAIFYSIQKEITEHGFTASEIDMKPFFTSTDLSTLGRIDDAEDFFLKGPGEDINGIQIKIAVPLLANFINTTDEYIQSKKVNAQLRFTHGETIAPFAAIMGIKGASTPVTDIKTFDKEWSAGKIMPLSSNIQWILCEKKGSENYLIKFLLNEKEVAIDGLSPKTFPFYNWKDVREFYKNKIEKFGSSLNENGYYYLLNLN
ncbi:MAG: histidine-type phosphatase [Ginsengibacter sp.]